MTPRMTVAEIATHRPASVRILEQHRIDFCCGGQVPFEQACRDRGLDPDTLLAEIERAEAPAADGRDWNAASLGELLDHILTTHHGYLKAELPYLSAALEKIEAAHGGKYPAIPALAPVFRALRAELEGHLMKEEMVLFPMIRGMETARDEGRPAPPAHCGSVRNPVRVMCMEHDSAGAALSDLRSLTAGYAAPDGACNTLRSFYSELEQLEKDLHRHIHLENNILFPRAIALEDGR